ncbi:MAG TPA: DinB family protein [Sporichthya sp.]|nr:DinB family protein [Sporichthya sp.]
MEIPDLLQELYGRIAPLSREAVRDLDAEALNYRPTPESNSIGWLVWHVARVLDHQICEQSGDRQLWVSGEWAGRLGRSADADDIGFGHTAERAAALRIDDPGVVLEYLDAVDARTGEYLGKLSGADLDRIIDASWDPPVSLGVRLVSVADDCLQHAGQAHYLRGLLGHPGKY